MTWFEDLSPCKSKDNFSLWAGSNEVTSTTKALFEKRSLILFSGCSLIHGSQ